MDLLPLAFAVGLALLHLVAGSIRPTAVVSQRRWLSFAGGVSVAYVFVHLLPELRHGQQTLAGVGPVESFLDHHAYLVALAGFVAFYGLEHAAQRRSSSGDDTTDVFWLHVGSFTVYNALVGYLLVHRLDGGRWDLAVFTLAMGLHFFVTDASLRRHHRRRYHRVGRWLLALAVVAGWGLGQVRSLSEPSLAVLVAFLAGGIILNVTKEELPAERESAFPAFVLGGVGYAALLLAV